MIASWVGVLSGRSALQEIAQEPKKFYGSQAAKIGIYASYFSAGMWFCLILGYSIFSLTTYHVV